MSLFERFPPVVLETILTHLAGLELSTDLNLNIVAPEHAAAALREA